MAIANNIYGGILAVANKTNLNNHDQLAYI